MERFENLSIFNWARVIEWCACMCVHCLMGVWVVCMYVCTCHGYLFAVFSEDMLKSVSSAQTAGMVSIPWADKRGWYCSEHTQDPPALTPGVGWLLLPSHLWPTGLVTLFVCVCVLAIHDVCSNSSLFNRLNSIDVKYQIWKLGVVFTDNVRIHVLVLHCMILQMYCDAWIPFINWQMWAGD